MTCPLCGISESDKIALQIITALPGVWKVVTHQGHIVKLARQQREMTVEEAASEYKTRLLTRKSGMVE